MDILINPQNFFIIYHSTNKVPLNLGLKKKSYHIRWKIK